MKKCIIVHWCPSNNTDPSYNKHRIPWVKKELVTNGIKTETPTMPTPWQPDYDKFKQVFEKYSVNEKTILIGHSCWCAFLVNWLWETNKKIHKLILVAPRKINDKGKDDTCREKFYWFSINETIKDNINSITMFTADDEGFEGKESLQIFHEALDGEIINLKNHGHYTLKHMWTEKFPELLKVVLS